MSTDAERLAALLHDNDLIALCFHARDGGGFAGPRACVEIAERLIAAGVGFPAAPDEGLDVDRLTAAEVRADLHEGLNEPFPSVRTRAEFVAVRVEPPHRRPAVRIDWSNVVVDEGDEAP